MATDDHSQNSGPVLKRHTLFAFAMPAVMLGFMHAPEAQVQGIYAKHAHLPLEALAAAMLLTRMFDAFTYPLIGALTDRTFRRTGSRKLWIIAGTLVTVLGLWFLYRPPQDVGITWFGCWFAVTYLGWKMTEIPYVAWSMGLTRDYEQRSRVQLWRGIATLFGAVVFYAVPLLTKQFGLTETSELNLQALAFTAVVVAVCVPLLNLYSLAVVPDGDPAPPEAAATAAGTQWRAMLHALRENKALLSLVGAFIPFTILSGVSSGVSYLFIDTYLGLAEQLTTILLIAMPCTLLGLPIWGLLCLKFERHRVWAISMVLTAVAYAGMGFAPPGPAGLKWILACYPVAAFCISAAVVAVPAMMGDIVDYDRLQTGRDRSGMFSAMLAFITKSLAGVSGALGLAALAWFGFDPNAKVQTAQGAFGVRFIGVWMTSLGLAVVAPLIWSFPITRARQKETLAALRQREADAAAIASAAQQAGA